jgi:separase
MLLQMESDMSDAIAKFHRRRCEILGETQRSTVGSNEHLILILDKKLQSLPWESIPCLRGLSVSRLPSLCFLRDRLILAEDSCKPQTTLVENALHQDLPDNTAKTPRLEIDIENTCYILNPSTDLINTQKEFEEFVRRYLVSQTPGVFKTD